MARRVFVWTPEDGLERKATGKPSVFILPWEAANNEKRLE
jgi:hypothetical protein